MRFRCILCIFLAVLVLGAASPPAEADEKPSELRWRKHTINDRSPYEAAGAAEFNGDGF